MWIMVHYQGEISWESAWSNEWKRLLCQEIDYRCLIWTISGSNWSTFPIDVKFYLISLKSANFSSSFAIRMRFVSSISMDVTNCGSFLFLLIAPSKGTEGLVSIWSDSWELCGSAETSIPQLTPSNVSVPLCYGSFPPMGLTLHQLVHPQFFDRFYFLRDQRFVFAQNVRPLLCDVISTPMHAVLTRGNSMSSQPVISPPSTDLFESSHVICQ